MLDIQNFIGAPQILVTDGDENVTKFEITNLPRWFGHTLWNAMRRIILAYNLGGSITGVKIKWVPHEYCVIDGVKEHVVNILLNFKKLRFSFDEGCDKIQWISQRFKGIGNYTAWDLDLPAGIHLLNPTEHLFEITDASAEVNMEIRIEKWYGYYSLEYLRNRAKREEASDVNILLIDNTLQYMYFPQKI